MRRSNPIEKKRLTNEPVNIVRRKKKTKKKFLIFCLQNFSAGPGYFDEAGGNSKQKITLFWPNARPIFEYIVDICLYESK